MMSWNESAQTLEINHIFHIHHAESALSQIGVLDTADLSILKNQARLALYVEDKFSLKSADGEALSLNLVGAEANGADIHVYQDIILDAPPKSLLVRCSFLRPPIAEQINEIHLNINNSVSSLRLSGRSYEKTLIAKSAN